MGNFADKAEADSTGILTSVKTIVDLIKGLFRPTGDTIIPPPPTKLELKIGKSYRQGLSQRDAASGIIDKMQKLGIPTGPLPSGAKNNYNTFVGLTVSEVYDDFRTNAKVDGLIDINQIVVDVTATAAGVPVKGFGINSQFMGSITGVIS